MKRKIVSIDFEYKEISDSKKYDIVCCSLYSKDIKESYWLVDDLELDAFKKRIRQLTEEKVIWTCHWAHAECWSLLSLDVEIDNMDFIDGFVEAKLNTNTDDKSIVKKVSLADLCIKHNIFNYYENDYKENMRKMVMHNSSYTEEQRRLITEYCDIDAKCSYKLLGKLIKEHEYIFKTKYSFQNAITRGNFIRASTVSSWVGIPINLEIFNAIKENYSTIIESFIVDAHEKVKECFVRKGLGYTFKKDIFENNVKELGLDKRWKRTEAGAFSTEGAYLKEMRHTHPFIESLQKVKKNIQSLKYLKPKPELDRAKELQKSHGLDVRFYDHLLQKEFFDHEGLIRKKDFLVKIEEENLEYTSFTKDGKPSLAKDNVLMFLSSNPKNKFAKELLSDMITIEACKTLNKRSRDLDTEDKDRGRDNEGISDILVGNKIHIPYGNFGTITGRNAPKAKYFLFAQSAWQRCLVEVPKGFKLVAFDFGSQEIYMGASYYRDETMLEAYFSKDFYLKTGVLLGMVDADDFETLTEDELKEKYGKERKILKALVLGIGYLMGVEKLGLSLYPDKSKNYAKQKATKLREKYRRTYNKFFKGSEEFVRETKRQAKLVNHWGALAFTRGTTANNFPIQGNSAQVLQELTIMTSNKKHHNKGIYQFVPLHDASYYLLKDDEDLQKRIDYVGRKMQEATEKVLKNNDRAIKIGYTVVSYGEVFYEKDKGTIEKIFDLIGCDKELKDFREFTIGN